MRILLFLLLLFCANLRSQNSCLFDSRMESWSEERTGFLERKKEVDNKIQDNIHRANSRSEIQIPVVVHLVWSQATEFLSDQMILSQIEALNRDFNKKNGDQSKVPEAFKSLIAEVGIQFYLADVDPDGEASNGILKIKTKVDSFGFSNAIYYTDRGGSDAWDTQKYLNIWVCNIGKNISGFGSYPGLTEPKETGVIVDYRYFGINGHSRYGLGRVAVHEVGHFLGLKHTWGEDSQCGTDDEVEDTPAQQRAYIGCPDYPQSSCGTDDLFMNFMDYVRDPCMLMFTEGQKLRMLSVLLVYRPGLMRESNAFDDTVNLSNNKFRVFPNPATAYIHIDFEFLQKSVKKWMLFSSGGQLLLQGEIFVNDQFELEISDLPAGIYFLKIGENTERIIKL